MFSKQLFEIIKEVIDFVEEKIFEDINLNEVIDKSYMSKSSFYAIFKEIFDFTIKDYIRKRRLSLSANELIYKKLNVLELAIKYGYNSSEAYSRAFKKMFGKTPTEYRKIGLYTDLFPKIKIEFSKGGKIIVRNDTNIEIIIESLKRTKEGFYLDIDIDEFADLNEKYGHKAGDKVLEIVPERIKEVLKEEKIKSEPVRINADEFGLIIKDIEIKQVEKLSDKIIKLMNKPVEFNDEKIDFTVSIGINRFTIGTKEETVLKNGTQAMIKAKKKGKNTYFIQ